MPVEYTLYPIQNLIKPIIQDDYDNDIFMENFDFHLKNYCEHLLEIR